MDIMQSIIHSDGTFYYSHKLNSTLKHVAQVILLKTEHFTSNFINNEIKRLNQNHDQIIRFKHRWKAIAIPRDSLNICSFFVLSMLNSFNILKINTKGIIT